MSSKDVFRDEEDRGKEGVSGSMMRHGSVRRVVHDGSFGLAARALAPPSPPSRYKALSTFMQEYSVMFEFNAVCDDCIPGLFVIPSAKSSLVWFGVLFARGGPYKGSAFRFTLLLPEGFPSTSSPPRIVLEGNIWHPNVYLESGEVELGLKWEKGKRVKEALLRFEELMSSPDTSISPPPNPHARNMYESNRSEFDKIAEESRERSLEGLLIKESEKGRGEVLGWDDPHYLRFETFQPEIHEASLKALKTDTSLKLKNSDWLNSFGIKRGPSWVAEGSLNPFSKLVL